MFVGSWLAELLRRSFWKSKQQDYVSNGLNDGPGTTNCFVDIDKTRFRLQQIRAYICFQWMCTVWTDHKPSMYTVPLSKGPLMELMLTVVMVGLAQVSATGKVYMFM